MILWFNNVETRLNEQFFFAIHNVLGWMSAFNVKCYSERSSLPFRIQLKKKWKQICTAVIFTAVLQALKRCALFYSNFNSSQFEILVMTK